MQHFVGAITITIATNSSKVTLCRYYYYCCCFVGMYDEARQSLFKCKELGADPEVYETALENLPYEVLQHWLRAGNSSISITAITITMPKPILHHPHSLVRWCLFP